MEFELRLPSDDPTERRRRQNRLAQRRFRLKHAEASVPRGHVNQPQPQIAHPNGHATSTSFVSSFVPSTSSHPALLPGPHDTVDQVGITVVEPEINVGGIDEFDAFIYGDDGSIQLPGVSPTAAVHGIAPVNQDSTFNPASTLSGTSPSRNRSATHPDSLQTGSGLAMTVPVSGLDIPHDAELNSQQHHAISRVTLPEPRSTISVLPPPRDSMQVLYESCPDASLRVLSTLSPEDAMNGWLGTLHIAAQKGNDSIVRMLLQQEKVDCNERDSDGRTALVYAVIEGHETVVRFLLAHGARVGVVDRDGRSALHWAVLHRRESVLRILLSQGEQGLDVNAYDVSGWTPLHMAIERDFEFGTMLLLQNGANLESKARKCPLMNRKKTGVLRGPLSEGFE